MSAWRQSRNEKVKAEQLALPSNRFRKHLGPGPTALREPRRSTLLTFPAVVPKPCSLPLRKLHISCGTGLTPPFPAPTPHHESPAAGRLRLQSLLAGRSTPPQV